MRRRRIRQVGRKWRVDKKWGMTRRTRESLANALLIGVIVALGIAVLGIVIYG